jgi:hypothetical protein
MEVLLLVGAAVAWVALGPLRRWVRELPRSNEDFLYY